MGESSIRALSGFIYILLLISATLYSEVSFSLLFGVFLLIAVVEFCKLIHLKNGLPIVLGLASYILFVAFRTNAFATDIAICLAALFVSVNLIIDLFSTRIHVKADKASKYVKLFGYIILPFILLMKLPFTASTFNPKIVIGVFVLIWTNDTFAYIVGKSFGKTKLFERISPKKTIEGFVGGLIFTMIGSYILSQFFTFFSPLTWIFTGLIVGFFGTIGDLVESKFKRVAGVKDSGKIMPGHGGILDRLDSVIFAIPFLYLFYQILNYVS
ncbi:MULTISPECIES: phosphatidate cytidylyltransferase [unclassified Flavobacterium]|uniref:phosphatidate cytidylyltransferase n=1 Tax=unclassified Flavobacterium TaxID=196869 RepID=UPI00095FF46B|nr:MULTISPECIES: phosphatidate cytidylyltransferase [unclassified Flavobacterium]MBN9285755.1 phosphatidate cytidylyltransferase [Flavobacterium sp.]OJV70364.1 MAG: phosphatidate cytidylyltransferase [Flavobacterium sp. 40-81]